MAGKKMTHEAFVERVYKLVGNEYTVSSKYKGSNTKIKMRHNTCGREYEVTPNGFKNGNRCRGCRNIELTIKRRKTTEVFKTDIFDLVGDEYTVLGEYVNNHTKVKMKHNVCGHEYTIEPDVFTRKGQRCKKCSDYKNKKKTTEIFEEEVFGLVGEEYEVLSEYKNSHTYVKIKHITCGSEYEVKPYSFLNGRRCLKCSGMMKKTTEIFKQEILEMFDDEYEVLSEYKNTKTKVLIRHNTCGNEWNVAPTDLLRGNKCPICNLSKGEKYIQNWLNKNEIEYEAQYRLDGCVYKRRLPFDFAIFSKGKLLLLIEYDGEQHFKPIKCFGGDQRFERQKIVDDIRNEYCAKNNIPLLRIPYWDLENIEDILKKTPQLRPLIKVGEEKM